MKYLMLLVCFIALVMDSPTPEESDNNDVRGGCPYDCCFGGRGYCCGHCGCARSLYGIYSRNSEANVTKSNSTDSEKFQCAGTDRLQDDCDIVFS